MKKIICTQGLAVLLAVALSAAAFGQELPDPNADVETEKLAQTSMKFLVTSVDARSTALGGAVTAEFYGNSTSQFYNPASMAGMEGNFHVGVSQLQFITDINYNVAALAFRPSGGNYGVFGVSVLAVDYGDFLGTIRANNEAGFVDTGTYSPTAMSVGVGYARSFTDRFSAGGNVKYVFQDIGDGFAITQDFDQQSGTSFTESAVTSTLDYSKATVAFDFGVVYQTGFRSLTIAMAARNFARELIYVRERFELPLIFQIGAQMNLLDLANMDPDMHQLVAHVDAQRPRDFNEHVKFGLEYSFAGILYLRGGYENIVSEEQGFSAGGGLHYDMSNLRLGADYAYTDFGLFGDVHRVGVQIGF